MFLENQIESEPKLFNSVQRNFLWYEFFYIAPRLCNMEVSPYYDVCIYTFLENLLMHNVETLATGVMRESRIFYDGCELLIILH